MKGNTIKFIGMVIMISSSFGCALGVNDTNPKSSKSISESKENGFFIAEYRIQQSPANMFNIAEVWQEKTWYYKVINLFKVEKEVRKEISQIVLRLEERQGSKYSKDNFDKWALVWEGTTQYVSFNIVSLQLGLDDWSSPKEIKLTLIEDPRGIKREAGTIILRLKEK